MRLLLKPTRNETPTNIPNPTNPIRMYCGVDVQLYSIMIDIAEIRRGNLLYKRGNNDIFEINDTESYLNVSRSPHLYLPITITEYWLLDFHYKLVNTNKHYKSFEGEPYVYLKENGLLEMSTGKPMKYIHELQNRVYSLTGKELTI